MLERCINCAVFRFRAAFALLSLSLESLEISAEKEMDVGRELKGKRVITTSVFYYFFLRIYFDRDK